MGAKEDLLESIVSFELGAKDQLETIVRLELGTKEDQLENIVSLKLGAKEDNSLKEINTIVMCLFIT